MKLLLIFFALGLTFLAYSFKNLYKKNNSNIFKFKKKFISKEANIEKIFSREAEKTSSDPNININIGLYENEENINRKSNIHRARLSKFKKSKLNGELIFIDQHQKIFKYINGEKKYI